MAIQNSAMFQTAHSLTNRLTIAGGGVFECHEQGALLPPSFCVALRCEMGRGTSPGMKIGAGQNEVTLRVMASSPNLAHLRSLNVHASRLNPTLP